MIGMQVTKETFFKQGSSNDEFANIVAKVIEAKKAINITFVDDNLINIEMCDASQELIFSGIYKYDFQSKSILNNIYLPYLTNISNIIISHQFFYYYPNEYRSIASVCTKNIVTVFLSSKLISFKKNDSKKVNSKIGAELAKYLFWDYKKLCKTVFDASSIKNMEYTVFAYSPLIALNLLNIQFLDVQSKESNKIIMEDYSLQANKRKIRELLSYRNNILNLRYGV